MTDSQVACESCNQTLDEPAGLPAEAREPCPESGSRDRRVNLRVSDTVSVHEQVALEAKRPGQRRPFREVRAGDDLHRKTGRWNERHRVIDRDADLYEEKIADPETGEVLRDVREPLSEHQGHGSAKPPLDG